MGTQIWGRYFAAPIAKADLQQTEILTDSVGRIQVGGTMSLASGGIVSAIIASGGGPISISGPVSALGASVVISSALTVTSGTVYSVGSSIGGAIVLSGLFKSPSFTNQLQDIEIIVAGSQTVNLSALLLNSTTSAALADKGAYAMPGPDIPKLIGTFIFTPQVTPGNSATIYQQQGIGKVLSGASSSGAVMILMPAGTMNSLTLGSGSTTFILGATLDNP